MHAWSPFPFGKSFWAQKTGFDLGADLWLHKCCPYYKWNPRTVSLGNIGLASRGEERSQLCVSARWSQWRGINSPEISMARAHSINQCPASSWKCRLPEPQRHLVQTASLCNYQLVWHCGSKQYPHGKFSGSVGAVKGQQPLMMGGGATATRQSAGYSMAIAIIYRLAHA